MCPQFIQPMPVRLASLLPCPFFCYYNKFPIKVLSVMRSNYTQSFDVKYSINGNVSTGVFRHDVFFICDYSSLSQLFTGSFLDAMCLQYLDQKPVVKYEFA